MLYHLKNQPLLHATLFSFSIHGLLACFLILTFPKIASEKGFPVEIVWKKPSLPRSHTSKEPSRKKKLLTLAKTPPVYFKTPLISAEPHTKPPSFAGSHSSSPPTKATNRANHPLPPYPWVCRKRRQEGIVSLEVKTDREGRVKEVNLYKSSGHPLLDKAALEAVRLWTFNENNTLKTLVIAFRLKDGKVSFS